MKVISFLSALNSQYESAKNQILAGADLPSLNAAFSRLSRISVDADPIPENDDRVALSAAVSSGSSLARGRGRGRTLSGRVGGRSGGKKEDRHCKFCHKKGHTEDKCWKKHGKPDWASKQDLSPATSSPNALASLQVLFSLMKTLHTPSNLLMVNPLQPPSLLHTKTCQYFKIFQASMACRFCCYRSYDQYP